MIRDDIVRAIGTLKPLGSYYRIVTAGKSKLIQSTPKELSLDNIDVLSSASDNEPVTINGLSHSLGWSRDRTILALDSLIESGMAWIDEQGPDFEANGTVLYWFPSLVANKV